MKTSALCLLISLITSSLVHADEIPPGCYVADYYRTDPCWSASNNFYTWKYFTSRQAGAIYYGFPVEAILNQFNLNEQSLTSCNVNLGSLSEQYTALNNEFVRNDSRHVDEYNALVGRYNALLATSNKLRRKCGKACKKIK